MTYFIPVYVSRPDPYIFEKTPIRVLNHTQQYLDINMCKRWEEYF